MSDILFQCPQCKKVLCVSDEAIGKTLSCTDCNTPIEIIEPATKFNCIKCDCELAAFGDIKGKSAQCPNCGEMIAVPRDYAGFRKKSQQEPEPQTSPATNSCPMENNFTIQCPHCKSDLEIDGSIDDLRGSTMDCPECGTKIVIPVKAPSLSKHAIRQTTSPLCPYCRASMPPKAIICVSCGTDLRTGEKVDTTSATQSQRPQPKTEIKQYQFKDKQRTVFCRQCGSEMYEGVPVCPNCHRKQATGQEDNTRFLPPGVKRYQSTIPSLNEPVYHNQRKPVSSRVVWRLPIKKRNDKSPTSL